MTRTSSMNWLRTSIFAVIALMAFAALAQIASQPAWAARNGIFTDAEPFRAFAAVTKSDSTTYGIPGADHPQPIEALYVGGTGDIALVGQDQATAVTLVGVPAGSVLYVSPYKIMSTNTSATGIVALYH